MKTRFRDPYRLLTRRLRQPLAFTLVELLVVMAILASLAGLLLPALSKARLRTQSLQCQNNFRRLAFAWLFYAEDNDGLLPPNRTNSSYSWVSGVMSMDPGASDSTNVAMLLDPLWSKMGPYLKSAEAFKCPSDKSTVPISGVSIPRVRSYSMNAAIGFAGKFGNEPFSPGWMTYKRMAQIARPSPDQLWVFTEEHPDGVTDCVFEVDCQSQGADDRFISVPANYHHGAANLFFADGHVELHSWLDERTKVANRYCGCLAHYEKEGFFLKTPYNTDVDWLQLHTSSKLEPQ